MEKCSPKGRDCFETHSYQTFNCSATCEGVYADVLWEANTIMKEDKEDELLGEEVEKVYGGNMAEVMENVRKEMERRDKRIMELERKVKGNTENKAEEIDKEKFKELLIEYKKYKKENVRHFRFHPNASSSVFGKSY